MSWNDEELAIFKEFNGRCVRCDRKSIVLHELMPKSKSPKEWMKKDNRCPLCAECHNWAHKISCKLSAPILRKLMDDKTSRKLHGRI